MRKIALTNGGVALVSDRKFKLVSKHKWRKWNPKGNRNWYAVATINKKSMVLMHQFITGKKNIDHKNRDGLDNRDSNLRQATKSQNMMNVALRRDSTSGFKGVTFNKRRNKWMARVHKNGEYIHCGYHLIVTDAARAYDKTARKLFGKFACTNEMLGLL